MFCSYLHKSQGQTLDKVLFDNRTDVFVHGCLYVALSRVRAAKDIRILVEPCRVSTRGFARVVNVVFKTLLANV